MGKVFRPSNKEAKILSKIESSKDFSRRQALNSIRDCLEPLSNALSMKLVENKLIETKSKNAIEKQLEKCLDRLTKADDFDVDYKIAPFRQIVPNPHIVSIYVTAFVIEDLIDHKDVVDIYGSDTEIYNCINKQILKFLS